MCAVVGGINMQLLCQITGSAFEHVQFYLHRSSSRALNNEVYKFWGGGLISCNVLS